MFGCETRAKGENVLVYGWKDWKRRSERMQQSLRGGQSQTGRAKEINGGCGLCLYLGDIVLVWADVGA